MLLGISVNKQLEYPIPDYSIPTNIMASFFETLLVVTKEVTIALGMVIVFFFVIL